MARVLKLDDVLVIIATVRSTMALFFTHSLSMDINPSVCRALLLFRPFWSLFHPTMDWADPSRV